MPKKPDKPKPASPGKPRYPSRERVKSVSIPKDYWEMLDAATRDDDRYEERTVAYLVRVAIREWLERHGKLPPRKPPPPGA
jgi:hypothetical protein